MDFASGMALESGHSGRPAKAQMLLGLRGVGKTVGLLHKLRHRGIGLVDWVFTFTAAAYDLVRLRSLLAGAVCP